jgi:hypothetical protein
VEKLSNHPELYFLNDSEEKSSIKPGDSIREKGERRREG